MADRHLAVVSGEDVETGRRDPDVLRLDQRRQAAQAIATGQLDAYLEPGPRLIAEIPSEAIPKPGSIMM